MRWHVLLGVALLVGAAIAPISTAQASTIQDSKTESIGQVTAVESPSQYDANCSFPVGRTDVTGQTVTVDAEPDRVVTLNPSAAQTMWEIGAWEQVVGVTKHASNLEGASEKHNVSGGGETINVEEVVGLEPDLVLAPNTVGNDTVQSLRNAGETVYRFREAQTVEGVYRKTHVIGELTGECDGAVQTVEWMQAEIDAVSNATAGRERPDAVYAFYGYTAGNGTFIHEILELAGANNVAADAGIEGYQQINQEVLVEQDPEWIVLNSDWDEVPATAAYNETTAVREGNVVVVNVNHLNRPAPRIVHAITRLAEAFHSAVYDASNVSENPAHVGGAGPANGTGTDDESSGAGPGFGIATMISAVVIALWTDRTGLSRRNRRNYGGRRGRGG